MYVLCVFLARLCDGFVSKVPECVLLSPDGGLPTAQLDNEVGCMFSLFLARMTTQYVCTQADRDERAPHLGVSAECV